MTKNEKLQEILQNADLNKSDVNALIAYAYYKGLCTGVKRVSDKCSSLLQEQKERAKNCRYHHMAMHVQGDVNYIYDGDYDQWIDEFGGDVFMEEQK